MTNCLFFAVALYRRRRAKGRRCYLALRGSDLCPGLPHFLVFELRRGAFRAISFKPTNPRHKILPPPLFAGRAAWGDAPPKNITTR